MSQQQELSVLEEDMLIMTSDDIIDIDWCEPTRIMSKEELESLLEEARKDLW